MVSRYLPIESSQHSLDSAGEIRQAALHFRRVAVFTHSHEWDITKNVELHRMNARKAVSHKEIQ
jgi:hypothetical protein